MAIWAALKAFAIKTSIKGIPRAVKAENPYTKIIWWFSTLVFLSIAGWQCYRLTSQYLSYEFTTKIYENITDLAAPNSSILPDVTICNVNPFAGNASQSMDLHSLPSLSEFKVLLDDLAECPHCQENSLEYFHEYVLSETSSTKGYYGLVGAENISKIGHQFEDLIISCKVKLLEGLGTRDTDCEGRVTIKHIKDPTRWNCYTIQAGEDAYKEYTAGFSIVAHLDNFFQEYEEFFEPDVSLSAGVSVVLHEKDTFPLLHRENQLMAAGSSTKILVELIERERLPPPYHWCTVQQNISSGFTYTLEACYTECLGEYIRFSCACQDLSYVISTGNEITAVPCTDVTKDVNALVNTTVCIAQAQYEGTAACFKKCPLACSEKEFHVGQSQTSWPSNPFTHKFYDSYVLGRNYEWRYKDLHDLIYGNPTNTSLPFIRDLVSKNFLRFDITLTQLVHHVYIDMPQQSTWGFMSTLGGALNLWAGITVILVLELIELFLELLFKRDRTEAKTMS